MVQMVLTDVFQRLARHSEPATKLILSLILLCLALPAESATYYVATTGSDLNPCSQSQRCKGFNRAYQVARSGDTVFVAPGTYSSQTIVRNANISGSNSQIPDGNEVTFKPESGPGTVTIQGLLMSEGFTAGVVEHIAFEDMTISGWMAIKRAGDVHFTRMKFRWVFQINCVDFYSIRDSDIGAHNAADGVDLYGNVCVAGSGHPSNGLLEGNVIHDINSTDSLAHPDAVALFAPSGGIKGFIMRRNKFYRNGCINYRGDVGTGHIIENNSFGDTVPFAGISCGVNVQIPGTNAQVRYNTIEGGVQQAGSGDSGQYWTGNIVTGRVGYGQCPSGTGTIAEYNVWNDDNPTNCGGAANTVVPSFGNYFVNLAPGGTTGSNLELTASATLAIGHGNQSNHPATDIDGKARPIAGTVDAGAYEFGTTVTINPPSGLTAIVR